MKDFDKFRADPRVVFYRAGGSHDWLVTRTKDEAIMLSKEYAFHVKYDPDQIGDIFYTAIR